MRSPPRTRTQDVGHCALLSSEDPPPTVRPQRTSRRFDVVPFASPDQGAARAMTAAYRTRPRNASAFDCNGTGGALHLNVHLPGAAHRKDDRQGAGLRDIAGAVGITERTAHRIIGELVEDGYVIRRRNGSRNEYEVSPDGAIHDPVLGERWVGEILAVVADSGGGAARPRRSVARCSHAPASGPPRALRAELS
jgi:hypothetical protein